MRKTGFLIILTAAVINIAMADSSKNFNRVNNNLDYIDELLLKADLSIQQQYLEDKKSEEKKFSNKAGIEKSKKNVNYDFSSLYKEKVIFSKSNDIFSASSASIKLSTLGSLNKDIKLKTKNGNLKISLPIDNNGSGSLSASSTLVFKGQSKSFADVAVQAFSDSIRIATIINDISSSTEYRYKINLNNGEKITQDDQGNVFIVTKNDLLIGGLTPAWAVDSKGRKIETFYKIDGDTIIQVVNHQLSDVQYPVIADPTIYGTYVQSAVWTSGSRGWTLRVTPTPYARKLSSYQAGYYGWIELYNRMSYDGLDTNLSGMQDQYICHQEWATWWDPNKPTWNLDEWRANVGYARTVFYRCNPGAPNQGILD